MANNELVLSLRIRTNPDGTREILSGVNQQLNAITASSENMGTQGAAAASRYAGAQASLLSVSSRLTAAQATATESTAALVQAQSTAAATAARLAASQTANAAAQAELVAAQTANAAAASVAATGQASAIRAVQLTTAQLATTQAQAAVAATELATAQTANATAATALTTAENTAAAATERLSIVQAQAVAATTRAAAITTVANTSLRDASIAATTATASFFGFKSMLAGFIGVATIGNIIKVNMEMESLRVRLVSVMKDADLATQVFNKMMKLDVTTPFGIQDLTAAFIKLKNFGMEPTDQVMWALTNTVAKLGGNADTLGGVTLALGQSWAKAKLQAQDTNQMIERGVPVYEALEHVTGRNTVALVKMMEAGELNRDVMAKMLIELGRMAEGSNARAMETLEGKISALDNSWTKFSDALLQDKSEGFIKSFVTTVSGGLDILTEKLKNTTPEMERMDRVLNRIVSLQAKIDFAKEHPIASAVSGVVFGNPFNEAVAQENLKAAIAEQQRLTNEIGKSKAAIDAKAKAQQDFAAKTKASADAASKAAAEQEAYAAFNKKYATDEQKLNIEITEQRKDLGSLFTKEAEDKIRAVFAHKAANSDAHKEAVKEIKELADLQEAAANAQIKDIQRVNIVRLADIESAKKANDNAYQDNKISALAHYQTEMALIEKTAQARIAALREQKAIQADLSANQLTDLDKAYKAILKIESAGGMKEQVNKSSHALGQMQVLPSTLRDPGYGVTPFKPAIDQNITKLMSYERLLKFVRENEEGLKKFGEDYFKGLATHYGSIDKAVNAYGEHTAEYMAKFKKYYAEINGQTVEGIKAAGEQKDIEAEVAKVQQESNQAKADATRQFLKETESYQNAIAALKVRYIELTGTAQEARAAQLALQNESNPLRKQATAMGDKQALSLLDKVQEAELNQGFTTRLKQLEDERLQLEMTAKEWAHYQNAKLTQDPIRQNILNAESDAAIDKKAVKKQLEYKVSFKDKELTDGLARAQKLATGLQTTFGRVGGAIGGMVVAMKTYGKVSNDIETQRAAITKENGYTAEQISIAQTKAAQEQAIAQIDAYASMTEAAQGFFKEGTTGYQLMGVATKAFRAYEMYLSSQSTITAIADMARTVGMWVTGEATKTAATVATVAPTVGAATAKATANAGVAVTNQGGGDPYTAFARIAMMIALMASVGFAVGGGGGAAAAMVDLSAERQKTQGTGSILGDATAKSKSIANSLELLKQNSDITLPLTSSMAMSLRNIESNIGGLGSQVARFRLNDPSFVSTTSLSGPQGITKLFVDVLGLFGSKTTTSLADSGLTAAAQSVRDIITSGVLQASAYMDIQYQKKGGLFSSSKSWVSRQWSDVDIEVQRQMAGVIQNIVSSIDTSAGFLDKSGIDFTTRLSDFVVSIGDVSLKGLKGDELQAELEAVFGKVADDMAKYAFSGLAGFQKAGEGYFETLVRVASGVEQATVGLDRLHIKSIAYTDIIKKQGDIYTEIVRQSIVAQETAAKGIAEIISIMGGTGDDLLSTYKQLSEIRDTMNLYGLRGNSMSSATVTGAGNVSDLSSAVDAYVDNYFSETEKVAAATANMQNQFLKLGLAMPTSTAKFRQLVESIDVSSAAGQKLQGQVLSLADAFYTATDLATKAIDNLQSNITTAEDNLRKAYQTESAALQQSIDDFGGVAKSLKEYLDDLMLSDVSTKTPLQKYQEARKQFDAVNALITTGTDAQKQEGLGKLQDVTQTFLESSRAYNASSMGYVRDFATATAALNNGFAISTSKADIAQLQLNALTDQVGKLITLNESVLSVKDAIDALAASKFELSEYQKGPNYLKFKEQEAVRLERYNQFVDTVMSHNTSPYLTKDIFKQNSPFIPAQYDPLKKYAKGGVSNTAAIFGEAGPEAAVPLPDGRTIPVTLSAPPMPAWFFTPPPAKSESQNDNTDVVAELKKLTEKQAELIEELKLQNELLKKGLDVDKYGYSELLKKSDSQIEILESMDRRERTKV
jgi:tape measure domain-containing protein